MCLVSERVCVWLLQAAAVYRSMFEEDGGVPATFQVQGEGEQGEEERGGRLQAMGVGKGGGVCGEGECRGRG